MVMITRGSAPNPRTTSDKNWVVPLSARKRVSMAAPTAMISNADVVISVSITAFLMLSQVSTRFNAATRNDSSAPMPPASVAVKAPLNRPPNTPSRISNNGQVSRSAIIRSVKLALPS